MKKRARHFIYMYQYLHFMSKDRNCRVLQKDPYVLSLYIPCFIMLQQHNTKKKTHSIIAELGASLQPNVFSVNPCNGHGHIRSALSPYHWTA